MYIKYLKYVLKHKRFVFIECCKLGVPIRGLLHDISKLLPSEFVPYAHYFYGAWVKESQWHGDRRNHIPWKYTEMGVEVAFDLAWLKHQKRNKHHWQYWLLKCDDGGTKALDMPLKHCKEMLADWIGTGLAITGKKEVADWYLRNKDNMKLHPNTRNWINEKVTKCK